MTHEKRTLVRNALLRLLGLPRTEDVATFDVVRDAASDEPQFADKLKSLIRSCPCVVRVYLFIAKVNMTADAFSAGLVFERDAVPDGAIARDLLANPGRRAGPASVALGWPARIG